MAIARGLSPSFDPSCSLPPAEVERRHLELARLQAEEAAASYRREILSARRRRTPERPGEKARRLDRARSAVARAREELQSRLERVGALSCPTAQQAVALVSGFRQASRTLEEVMNLLQNAPPGVRGPS
jgi:hypothetical protein